MMPVLRVGMVMRTDGLRLKYQEALECAMAAAASRLVDDCWKARLLK